MLKAGTVDPDELLVFAGSCCSISSLYFKFPDCCGCYNNSTCCCFVNEGVCCKPSNVEGECCVVNRSECTMVYPIVCCKGVQQQFCFDNRCSFPCDDEVPCIFGYCFIVCCYEWQPVCKCCSNLSEFRKAALADQQLQYPQQQQQQQYPQQQYPQQPQYPPQQYPPQANTGKQHDADQRLSFAESYPASAYDDDYQQPSAPPVQGPSISSKGSGPVLHEEASPYRDPRRISGPMEKNPMASPPRQPMHLAPRPGGGNPLVLKPIASPSSRSGPRGPPPSGARPPPGSIAVHHHH